MSFTPKRRSHSESSAYNMKKGIRCNYIPNMKALAQVLIEKGIRCNYISKRKALAQILMNENANLP